ncbi:hypothetical protein WA158_001424 [Blastocystis sp. Blastoise]
MNVQVKYTETPVKPLLFGFQNSIPSVEEFEDAKSAAYINHVEPKQVAIKIKTNNMEYDGVAPEEPTNEILLVGVYNSKKNSITCMKASAIVPLVQTVSSLNPDKNTSSTFDHFTRRKMLVDTFGNKKSKQIQRAYEISTVTNSNILGSENLKTILEEKGSKADVPEFKPVKRSRNGGGKSKGRK